MLLERLSRQRMSRSCCLLIRAVTQRRWRRDAACGWRGRLLLSLIMIASRTTNADATRQFPHGSEDVLTKESLREGLLHLARGCLAFVNDIEKGAILDSTRWIGAGIDGFLEEVRLPTSDEVTMVAKAGGISIGKDEAAVAVLESSSIPDNFEEQAWQADGVGIGTGSSHDEVRESHVVSVVLTVGVFAIPARLEHELQSEAIRTVLVEIGLVRKVVAVQGSLRRLAVVEAVESKGTLRQILLLCLTERSPLRLRRVRLAWVTYGISPSFVASGNHLESFGESSNVVAIQEVVRQHATNLRDKLDFSSAGILEIESWVPVGRLVLRYST